MKERGRRRQKRRPPGSERRFPGEIPSVVDPYNGQMTIRDTEDNVGTSACGQCKACLAGFQRAGVRCADLSEQGFREDPVRTQGDKVLPGLHGLGIVRKTKIDGE